MVFSHATVDMEYFLQYFFQELFFIQDIPSQLLSNIWTQLIHPWHLALHPLTLLSALESQDLCIIHIDDKGNWDSRKPGHDRNVCKYLRKREPKNSRLLDLHSPPRTQCQFTGLFQGSGGRKQNEERNRSSGWAGGEDMHCRCHNHRDRVRSFPFKFPYLPFGCFMMAKMTMSSRRAWVSKVFIPLVSAD